MSSVPLLFVNNGGDEELDINFSSPLEETRHPSFALKNNFGDELNSDLTSIIDFIRKSKTVYLFSIFTGVLEPSHLPFPTKPALLRYYSFLLHLFFISGTIGIFVLYCTSLKDGLIPLNSVAVSTYFIGMVIQNILIYAASKAFHFSLSQKRPDISYNFYLKCFQDALPFVIFIIAGFFIVAFVFCGLLFDERTGLKGVNVVFAIMGVLTLVVPSTLISIGLMTFILLEQKITLRQINIFLDDIQSGKIVSVEEYFTMRENNLRRNKQTFWCLSWMIISTIWNTLCGLILAFTETKLLLESGLLFALFTIFYTLIMFGRQALILVVMLSQIGEVNQVSEKIPSILVKQHWNHDLVSDGWHLEIQRLSLLAACKESPLGSTIFGMRLTNFQVQAQVCLFVLAFAVSFLRSIFIASLQG